MTLDQRVSTDADDDDNESSREEEEEETAAANERRTTDKDLTFGYILADLRVRDSPHTHTVPAAAAAVAC